MVRKRLRKKRKERINIDTLSNNAIKTSGLPFSQHITKRRSIMSNTKYILVTDCDCHWYVIPFDKELSWDSWCKVNINDGEYPDYATAVGGSPSLVMFENFEVRK